MAFRWSRGRIALLLTGSRREIHRGVPLSGNIPGIESELALWSGIGTRDASLRTLGCLRAFTRTWDLLLGRFLLVSEGQLNLEVVVFADLHHLVHERLFGEFGVFGKFDPVHLCRCELSSL